MDKTTRCILHVGHAGRHLFTVTTASVYLAGDCRAQQPHDERVDLIREHDADSEQCDPDDFRDIGGVGVEPR